MSKETTRRIVRTMLIVIIVSGINYCDAHDLYHCYDPPAASFTTTAVLLKLVLLLVTLLLPLLQVLPLLVLLLKLVLVVLLLPRTDF